MKKRIFHLPQDDIESIVASLNAEKPGTLTAEEIQRAEMLLEETYLRLAKGMNNPELPASVKVKKRFGDIRLELSARGEAANPIMSLTEWIEDAADLYSANVLKSHRHLLGYSRRNGENVISIKIHEGGGREMLHRLQHHRLGFAGKERRYAGRSDIQKRMMFLKKGLRVKNFSFMRSPFSQYAFFRCLSKQCYGIF